jgi:hypothetical protein
MYREIQGRFFMKFEKTVVAVPRCPACRAVHRRYKQMSYALSCVVVVLVLAVSLRVHSAASLWNIVSVMGAASILAVVGAEIINRWWFERVAIPRRHFIKSQSNVHEANVVRQMQFKGWSLRDPTPS